MRGVIRPVPKFLAIVTSLNARCLSVRTEIPGGIYQYGCELFFAQNRNSWRYFPVWTRGVFRSEPKRLAVFTSLNARLFSARTKIPGGICQFACEASVGRKPSAWRYFPVCMRSVFRAGPELLAIFSSLNARCLSVRTRTPGDVSQFKCEVFVGQNQNSWRYFPIRTLSGFQSEPKFLATFPSPHVRCYSVRTWIPGGISQFKCGVPVGQDPMSWQYLPV